MYMKCSASESKAFLIDLDAWLFMFLIQLLGPAQKSSASEPGLRDLRL